MKPAMDKVLILDGAKEMSELLQEFLSGRGCSVHIETEAAQALGSVSKNHFDFLLISERIQGLAAVEFVKKAVAVNPDLYVILASSKEELSAQIRVFHKQFRRLPSPLVLEDLFKVIQANTRQLGSNIGNF